MQNNTLSVLNELISYYQIPVTKTSVENELEKHLNSNSLIAISDLLNYWKVPNAAFKVQTKALKRLPLPCVVHLHTNNGEFALIHQISDEHISISQGSTKKTNLSINDFNNKFSGNVLVVEKDEISGEKDFNDKRKKELFKNLQSTILIVGIVFVVTLGLILHGGFIRSLNWQILLLAIIKTIGLTTSILLLMQSIDANNPLIERLCTGKQSDCNAILSSKAAKITDWLSWSEIGFFYFGGTWLFLLFNTNPAQVLPLLAFINLLCLPYTFYSIYYQWRVAKHWCLFCITIQAVLWFEFLTLASNISFRVQELAIILRMLLACTLPVIAWYFVKPFFKAAQKKRPLEQQLKHFKYNSELFKTALESQNQLRLLNDADTIILGNTSAKNIVTVVTNPFCQPCSKAHKIFTQWLPEKDSFKLQIVFSTKNDENADKDIVADFFYQLYMKEKETAYMAMHDWYEGKYKNAEALMKVYLGDESTNFSKALHLHAEWCEYAGIDRTPTILLNGYPIPKPWQYLDIRYFL